MSISISAVRGEPRIAVIGQGYVGLPLAVEFGKHHDTLGFDIDAGRIAELQAGHDRTLETTPAELRGSPLLRFGADAATDGDIHRRREGQDVDDHEDSDPRP